MVMSKHQLSETLEELSEYRGRNTELVSLYIPPDYDIRKIVEFLNSEQSEAQNIKSKNTRKNVISALEKMERRLKNAGEIPENGIALFAGNVSEQEGRPDIQMWEVEPPEPIESRIYRCDKEFQLDDLEDLLIDKEVYGMICLDKSEAAVGYVRGNHLTVEYTLDSQVPGKTTKGGQCLKKDTNIVLPSGNIKKVSEMDENTKTVVSVDFEDNSLKSTEHNSVFTSKHTSYYTVKTKNPKKEIEVTGDHKVFVFNENGVEEKFVEEIQEGDFLLRTRNNDIFGEVFEVDQDIPFKLYLSSSGAERIKERRKEKGLTQKVLGNKTEVSQTAISKFEKGERNPSKTTLERILDALDIDEDGFIENYCTKEKKFRLPETIGKDFAMFLGYFQGDGSVDNNRLEFYEGREEVATGYSRLLKEIFGLEPRIKYREDKNYYRTRIYSNSLVRRLEKMFPNVFNNSNASGVPEKILRSGDEVLAGYLKGLFDAEGSVTQDEVSLSMVNEELVRNVALAMERFGISASINENVVPLNQVEGKKEISVQRRIRISDGLSLKNFYENIGFSSEQKERTLLDLVESRGNRSRTDKIPLRGSDVREMAETVGMNTQDFEEFNPYFRDEKFISYSRFKRGILPKFRERKEQSEDLRITEKLKEIIKTLEKAVSGDISLTKVCEKEKHELNEEEEFYDIEVPGYRNFVANGIVVHNSQQRFERIRENLYDTFLNQIAEKSKKAFLEKARNDELLGLIVGGPGFSKEDITEKNYLPKELLDKLLTTIGTNYSGEEGLKELLNKSEDIIEESEAVREKKTVNQFLVNLKKENGKSVFGMEDVAKALKMGAVKTLLISEEFDQKEAKFECTSCGHKEIKRLTEFEAEQERHDCEECGSKMELVEKKDVVDMFQKKAGQMDSSVMFISRQHEEGERLWKMGGVAAILRYRIQ